MDYQTEPRKVLKDVSNLTNRKLVPAFPVNMEDKENADPRKLTKKVEEEVIPEVKKVDIGRVDSDTSSDGFEVDEDFKLDGSDEDLDDTLPLASNDKKEEEEVPSPFLVSNLLTNKIIADVKLETDQDNNGASPLFDSQQAAVRQERRKLDFSNLDTSGSTGVSPSLNSHQRATPLRRCFSMVETQNLQLKTVNSSPEMSKFCEDMTSPLSRPFASFKRPNAPLQPLNNLDLQQPCKKIRRGFSLKENRREEFASSSRNFEDHFNKSASTSMLDSPQIAKPMLQLSLSESENIKRACSLADNPNLTGDRSRPLSLPTFKLKTLDNVDCHTLADLLRGKYNDKIASFRIVDARYCYEFKGGHIRGAENFGAWDEEAFFNEFLPKNLGTIESPPGKEEKANIIIFHCEFSSARGPTLMKLLRDRDRSVNVLNYPALHYPEIYLLSQGYKEFYKHYPELCEPRNYVPMSDPAFAQEERKFHRKSKSWAAPGGTISRTKSTSRLLKL